MMHAHGGGRHLIYRSQSSDEVNDIYNVAHLSWRSYGCAGLWKLFRRIQRSVVSRVEEDKRLTVDVSITTEHGNIAADVSATFTLSTVASRYR